MAQNSRPITDLDRTERLYRTNTTQADSLDAPALAKETETAMLKNIALIALLTTMWVGPLAAQSEAPIIRTALGLRYEIPAGWEWTKFDGNSVTVQHVATKSGEKGKESSVNRFTVHEGKIYGDDFNRWTEDRFDRIGQRTFPNGVTARWKAGPRREFGHYLFWGEATIGSKALKVEHLGSNPPRLDVGLVESAFLRVVETLRDVPESAVIYHPSLRIAVDSLKSKAWSSSCGGLNVAFRHYVNGIGKSSNAHIYAYPTSTVFPNTGKALADITSSFEKSSSLRIGEVRRVDVPGGEVLWTEQPGTTLPFLAAVRRDGRYFFVQMHGGTSVTSASDAVAVREDFLSVAKSVRTWDGN